jgi:hypothetical protein
VASIEIAPGWVDAVQKYVDGLVVNSIAAAESASNSFYNAVVARAREDEDWSSLADNITLWNQDGGLMIGVQGEQFASLATLLEYGDLDASPNPLFRTLTSAAKDADTVMRRELEARYGPNMNNIPRQQGLVRYGR